MLHLMCREAFKSPKVTNVLLYIRLRAIADNAEFIQVSSRSLANLASFFLAAQSLGVQEIISTIDTTDNVYMCIKDRDSCFLWVNDNFANLYEEFFHAEDVVGKFDPNMEGDKALLECGVPLFNHEENITVQNKTIAFRSQKGLFRNKSNPNEIIGISTVCFLKI